MREARHAQLNALGFLLGIALVGFQLANVQGLDDGRIGVLYVGCLARSTPFWWMRSDPLFSMYFVQATLRDWANWGPTQQAISELQVFRMIRLYMPRSYHDLTSRFDVLIMANANREAVTPHNTEMLARGVREGGMGFVMCGGWESFGGAFSRPSWGDTSIGALLPTNDVPGTYVLQPAGDLRLIIDKPDNEFIKSIPWDPTQPFMTNFEHNIVTAKEGANVLAHVESTFFKDHPGMVTWEIEGGVRTFAITGEIIGPGSEPGQVHTMCYRGGPWKYAIDFGCNLMIYLDRRPVPQDVELVHAVRSIMFDTSTRRTLLVGLLEFCDSFGANTDRIVSKMDEAQDLISAAIPSYLELRFEEVLEAYEKVGAMLLQIEEEAVRLKNRTLTWVYAIEWMAVTGTSLVCGVVLWSLMIRRRFYREVQTTKLLI